MKKIEIKKDLLFTLVYLFLSKKMLKICFLHYENNASLQHSFDGSIKITALYSVAKVAIDDETTTLHTAQHKSVPAKAGE